MSSSASSGARRPWLVILVLLAVIDVVTVAALLSRNQRLMEISQDVDAFSEQWASRLEKLSALRGLAHEVLVDSRGGAADLNSENNRLGQAVASYINWTDVVRKDLSALSAAEREAFEVELNAVSSAVDRIATHRLAAIKLRHAGDVERATREMTLAAHASSTLGQRFSNLEAALRAGQSAVLAAQQEAAYSVRRADLAIAGINLMLVVASLFARSSSLVASDAPSSSTTILDQDVRAAMPVAQPVAALAQAGERPPSLQPAAAPVADLSPEGLDDFPSEFDVQSWRKAG